MGHLLPLATQDFRRIQNWNGAQAYKVKSENKLGYFLQYVQLITIKENQPKKELIL